MPLSPDKEDKIKALRTKSEKLKLFPSRMAKRGEVAEVLDLVLDIAEGKFNA